MFEILEAIFWNIFKTAIAAINALLHHSKYIRYALLLVTSITWSSINWHWGYPRTNRINSTWRISSEVILLTLKPVLLGFINLIILPVVVNRKTTLLPNALKEVSDNNKKWQEIKIYCPYRWILKSYAAKWSSNGNKILISSSSKHSVTCM